MVSLNHPTLDDLQLLITFKNGLIESGKRHLQLSLEYQLAAYKIETAENEQTVLLETSTLLKGHERGYRRAYNQPFSDFPKNVGFNDGASAAQPDMVEGLDLTRAYI